MKNIILARKIKQEIKKLNPQNFPNTLTRANAAFSYLNGNGTQKEIAAIFEVFVTAIANSVKKYKESGIDGLKSIVSYSCFSLSSRQ